MGETVSFTAQSKHGCDVFWRHCGRIYCIEDGVAYIKCFALPLERLKREPESNVLREKERTW